MPIVPGIPLRKDEILQKVSQEQIFESYLGLPIDTGTLYINPLRVDKRPGCRFYYKGSKLYFHDFGKYHWDCFAVVQYKFNCSFIDALRIIVKDFRLNNLSAANTAPVYTQEAKIRETIRVKVRDWDKQDLLYWSQYNITQDILKKFQVYPCSVVWLRGELYKISKKDPCYCYYFGNEMYKLYFPLRDYNRFFQNITTKDNILQGQNQLPQTHPYLILTKSLKDVMSMYSIGICSVAVLSEYHLLDEQSIHSLSIRFPNIITLFDNDVTGRKLTNKYRELYNTKYLIFPKTMGKDFSDNMKMYDAIKMTQICQEIKKKLNLQQFL